MSSERPLPIHLASSEPYPVTIRVESVGPDLLCTVHGGAEHAGSVAMSEWRDGRPHTRCLTAEAHREEAIARHAAHTLCAAARSTVVCVAGIHFDAVTRRDIDRISRQAYELARRAAGRIRDARIRSRLHEEGSLYRRIAHGLPEAEVEVRRWFAAPASRLLEEHGAAIRGRREEAFGRAVRLFAPLYLSNACTNDCVYCGFRRSSDYRRIRLTTEQAVAEAQALVDRGIRSVDLVTGEIPSDPFVDYVARTTEALLAETGIVRVHLNLGSLSEAQYRRLRRSGAAGVHVYQETYDPAVYLETHRAGGKRDMAARLEAPHRAAGAGFEYVGLGVLLGLGDAERDLAAMARHGAVLREDFPSLGLGYSLPRVQEMEADPGYVPARPVSDEDFLRAMLFLRSGDPRAHLTLTTRERPEIRDLLLRYGITKLSAGVSTAPGGYAEDAGADPAEAREQFHVADERSVEEIAALVGSAGLEPVFD